MAPATDANQQAYTAVPNEGPSSPTQPGFPSPDPNASSNVDRNSNLLSPDPDNAALFGGPGSEYLPAPSIMTRDSTYSSLPGTPPLRGDERKSWGSGVGLAAAAGGIAGSEAARRPGSMARAPSGLAHSSLGWNNTTNDRLSVSDEDEEQGHITPAVAGIGAAEVQNEKPRWAETGAETSPKKKNRKLLYGCLCVGLLALIALGVGLGVGLTRKNKTNGGSPGSESGNSGEDNKSASGSGTATASGTATSAAPSATPTSGTQGSLITLEDGSTMTYDNPFGGEWHWDEANPFNSTARPNSWTPRLNEAWDYTKNRIYGVNTGGWLVTEPFIVPGLYEKYAEVNGQTAIDEYTLSQNMGSNLTAAMTEHYETFITERDFYEMSAAGINWVRIPIGFWALETWENEPFLERVSWTYLLKALKWCRKYGLRVNLDLHAVPGSENGWNHSGRQGTVNWLNGAMGLANAQRALDYIRSLAQFIAQPQYSDVVQMFGFINEPNANTVGKNSVGSFYHEAHNIIREITGVGAGNGPHLSVHDGFLGVSNWYGFMPNLDRVDLDQHNYMVFQDQPTGDLDELKVKPCQYWAASTNTSFQQWGPTNTGEWSAAWNDCGQWVNNVGSGSRYDGSYNGYANKVTGSCDYWNDYRQWNQSTIDALNHFVKGSMDSFQDYFFWTWKIGNSTGDIPQPNPFWNYQLGLEHGWVPKDPREAIGTCEGDGVTSNPWDGTFSNPAVTGGSGAGQIPASQSAQYPWPPASISNAEDIDSLYQYTQIADPITLPAATFTSPGSTATIDAGDGWHQPSDTRKAYAAITGCSYAPEYSAVNFNMPASACGAGLSQPTKRSATEVVEKRQPEAAAYAQPTTPPSRR
ncbi:glucan 1,3-beta-glucosidase [Kwoniella heveanensis CBS 569]|nr:glucan 1,3-beta-glucosidase [Kwoniella heveanensis CBS 569]